MELTEDKFNQLMYIYNTFSNFNSNIFSFRKFKKIVSELNANHHILVYIQNNIIIGAITLLIEQKLIHDGKCVGHIEDLAINVNYMNKGIGSLLLDHVIELSKLNNCYKCILDCNLSLENYYKKKGFVKKGIYMGLYF